MPQKFFQGITDFIFVEHTPKKADIIFIPGGNYPEAAEHAASLYHQGLAPLLLPSGRYSVMQGYFPGAYDTEWEYLQQVLLRCGVPKDAILKEDQATFTYENAIKSRNVTDTMGIQVKQAILSCKSFHARRALMYYQEQCPDTEFFVSPTVVQDIRRDNWFMDQEKITLVLGEVERCGAQFHEIMKTYAEEHHD